MNNLVKGKTSNWEIVIGLEIHAQIKSNSKFDETSIEIKIIKTSGDIFQNKRISDIGGKGVFCKQIEEELLDLKIDLAVHSLKDIPTQMTEGLCVNAVVKRNDPRDVFVSFKYSNLKELKGVVMGSSSRRRDLQLRLINKNVLVKNIRGNIDTRIQKLKDGLYDGIILALAGIKTLKLEENIKHIFSAEEMLPAVGQGIIAVQCRKEDTNIINLLGKIDHAQTRQCAEAERNLLKVIGGDCDTAVGGLATIKNNELTLYAQLFSDDGINIFNYKTAGSKEEGLKLGKLAGVELLKQAGTNFKKN